MSLLVSRKENLSQTHLLVSYIPYSLAQKRIKLTGLGYVHIIHVPDIYYRCTRLVSIKERSELRTQEKREAVTRQ